MLDQPAYPGPFVRADAADGLPFAPATFDLVYCSSVIEHVARERRGKFAAEVRYSLEQGALRVTLKVTNRGPDRLPFGLGLHPWFPRTPGTTLQARAAVVTLEDRLHLPNGQIAVASREEWNFSAHRRLPHGWINNEFSPWDGHAEIIWSDRGLRLSIEAEGALSAYILYSPAFDADFFCFEPVTHLVDAHNRAGGPKANGLAILDHRDDLAIACRFVPIRL